MTEKERKEHLDRLLLEFNDYATSIEECESKITQYLGERSLYVERLRETAKVYNEIASGHDSWIL